MAAKIARVKWAAHGNEMTSFVQTLHSKIAFSDCQLVCSDGFCIPAHQVVLSLASPFFKSIFTSYNSLHGVPTILLDGVNRKEAESLLYYIYCGYAIVPCDQLATISRTARHLGIKDFPSLEIAPASKKWQPSVENKHETPDTFDTSKISEERANLFDKRFIFSEQQGSATGFHFPPLKKRKWLDSEITQNQHVQHLDEQIRKDNVVIEDNEGERDTEESNDFDFSVRLHKYNSTIQDKDRPGPVKILKSEKKLNPVQIVKNSIDKLLSPQMLSSVRPDLSSTLDKYPRSSVSVSPKRVTSPQPGNWRPNSTPTPTHTSSSISVFSKAQQQETNDISVEYCNIVPKPSRGTPRVTAPHEYFYNRPTIDQPGSTSFLRVEPPHGHPPVVHPMPFKQRYPLYSKNPYRPYIPHFKELSPKCKPNPEVQIIKTQDKCLTSSSAELTTDLDEKGTIRSSPTEDKSDSVAELPTSNEPDPHLTKISSAKRRRFRGPKSWEYLLRLLRDPSTNPSLIRWENEKEGIFRLMKPETIALRWGKRTEKHCTDMLSYENFARGLRYHYVTGALTAVSERCFVYKFGPKAQKALELLENSESSPCQVKDE